MNDKKKKIHDTCSKGNGNFITPLGFIKCYSAALFKFIKR